MAKPDPRQVRRHRERLGELVSAAREARGWSQARLGEAIAGSQSKITRIELGKGATTISDVKRIIEELRPDAGTAEEMVRLAEAAPRGKYWTGKRGKTPKHTRRLVELEPEALTIRAVHGDRMPGLLQSDMYMWRQAGLRVDMDKMTDEISNRIERKKIFDLDQAPDIHYILSESSVRRTVRGCTATALHQIRELLRLDEKYPKLRIRILPFDADIDFVPVDFTILEFPDRRRDLVYVEYATAAANLSKPADLSTYRELWEKLDAAALSCADSRTFLQRAQKEFDETPSG